MVGEKLFDFFELARQENGRFLVREDYIDEFTTIRGLAARGTLDSEAAWLLEKTRIVLGVIVEVEYADNAAFTQEWDDRLASFASGAGSTGISNFAIPSVRILDSDGLVIDTSNPLDVSQGGLSTDMRVTVQVITDVAAALPAVSLVNRNSMIILNKDASNTVFIDDNIGVTTAGWEVDAQTYFSLDITDGIRIFAICSAGQTATVKLLELA